MSILQLLWQAGWVVKLVLLALTGASVMCWAIILVKGRTLRQAQRSEASFLQVFWASKSLEEIFSKSDQFPHAPSAQVFKSGFKELQKLSSTDRTPGGAMEVGNVQRALHRTHASVIAGLEKRLGWLATTASAAPFVGLFGTVWGIMTSFQMIGATGAASLAVVAPGISEALIATAVGLAAAIPAVIAYNHFVQKIRRVAVDLDGFCQDFLNIVQRGLLAGGRK